MKEQREVSSVFSEKVIRVGRVNEAFRNGKEAWEVLDDLRDIERPILVDFNNVLANNRFPMISNPEGKNFLRDLSEIGDVIIATTAESWEGVHGFLKQHKMWSDDQILMTTPTYRFLTEYTSNLFGEVRSAKEKIMEDFQDTLEQRGIDFDPRDFDSLAPAQKPLSPLFNKPFDIPLVDDSPIATEVPFPGIKGLRVDPFLDEVEKEWAWDEDEPGLSLAEAVEEVRNHYTAIK